MKILLVGSGGREHALAWKMAQSPLCEALFCAPGNAGTKMHGTNVPIKDTDVAGLVKLAKDKAIDLVVVGPEDPLAAGLGDAVREAGILCFGPTRPTAPASRPTRPTPRTSCGRPPSPRPRRGSSPTSSPPRTTSSRREHGVVVKAAGLAKGKGVFVCPRALPGRQAAGRDDGSRRLRRRRQHGRHRGAARPARRRRCWPCATARASTRWSRSRTTSPSATATPAPTPAAWARTAPCRSSTRDLLDRVEREILVPIVDAMRRDFGRYEGVLYAGLMLTPAGPKVLEFNCRFGDPECQPLHDAPQERPGGGDGGRRPSTGWTRSRWSGTRARPSAW